MDEELLKALGFKKLKTEKADGFLVEHFEVLERGWIYRRIDPNSNLKPKYPITGDMIKEYHLRQTIPLTLAEEDTVNLIIRYVYQ